MNKIFMEKIVTDLSLGMNWSVARQKALADNLANIDTPGYKRKDISFPKALTAATAYNALPLRRTRDSHLATASRGILEFPEVPTKHRNDENNVDVELEMAELIRNSLYYNALVDRASDYFRSLRLVISEGRR